jgi:hypothetical protein
MEAFGPGQSFSFIKLFEGRASPTHDQFFYPVFFGPFIVSQFFLGRLFWAIYCEQFIKGRGQLGPGP